MPLFSSQLILAEKIYVHHWQKKEIQIEVLTRCNSQTLMFMPHLSVMQRIDILMISSATVLVLFEIAEITDCSECSAYQ